MAESVKVYQLEPGTLAYYVGDLVLHLCAPV